MVTRLATPDVAAALAQLGLTAHAMPVAQTCGQLFTLQVPLGAQPAGTLVVPSLARLGGGAPWRFVLCAGEAEWPLPWVTGGGLTRQPDNAPGAAVRALVDCWQLDQPLTHASVRLEATFDPASAACLVSVSARARRLDVRAGVTTLAGHADVDVPVPAISQRQLAVPHPGAVCSATATTMVMGALGVPVPAERVAMETADANHGMYGIWPLALQAAARRGCLGSIEIFAHLADALALCTRGVPVVCSINYPSGGLPGAAGNATGGHLVVLRGCRDDGHRLLLNDPGGATDADVACEVDSADFARAWLADRGVGYVLLPPSALSCCAHS